MAALIACYLALFVKHRLSLGERGMVLVLSASVTQSRTVYSYILAFLNKSLVLKKEIASFTKEEIA